MFDNYVWCDEKVNAVKDVNEKSGFVLNTLITYYRGIPLSMIDNFRVFIDGEEVGRDKIKFCPNGEDWFTLDEMETITTYRWEYGVEGKVFVEYEGGLPHGNHEIALKQSIRVAYIPVPFGGEKTITVSC